MINKVFQTFNVWNTHGKLRKEKSPATDPGKNFFTTVVDNGPGHRTYKFVSSKAVLRLLYLTVYA